jgi:RHS repeat-associated protein
MVILAVLVLLIFSAPDRLFCVSAVQNAQNSWAVQPSGEETMWFSSPADFISYHLNYLKSIGYEPIYVSSISNGSYITGVAGYSCTLPSTPCVVVKFAVVGSNYEAGQDFLEYRGSSNVGQVCPDGSYVVSGRTCAGKSLGKQHDKNYCPCSNTGSVPVSNTGSAGVGDPIDVGSGNGYQETADYSTAGQNAFRFVRFYNSLSSLTTPSTELGTFWRSNFDRYIILDLYNMPNSVVAERANGQQFVFTLTSGVWSSDSDVDITLTESGNVWKLVDHDDMVETYTTNGTGLVAVLNTIQARNGYTQTLNYDASVPSQVDSVTDSYGRTLSFTYANGLISALTTPDGTTISYGYTPVSLNYSNNLTSITYPATTPSTLTYVYESSTLPNALTGIIDEDGNRYATWNYDGYGRGISDALGGSAVNADLTTITYNDTDGSRTVINALGATDTYTFATLQNIPKLAQINRAATGNTAAAAETFSYDSNGYLAGKTDWNGNQTTYINDAHGDPTSITEAAGANVARTTTITYDPTWVHLPDSIATPGLTTTFTYDGNGEQLTRTLADTTTNSSPYSTNGQSRTWTDTWSNYLLASVQTPNGNTTTFGYDGTGALTSVADPLQHVTTISSHTPGGLPLVIVDPNGVSTTLTYNPRQWPTSRTVSGTGGTFVTSWAYDAAGNLIATTLPDNSYLTDTYDTAHRLTQITDALGSYVDFTLDALGDRTQTTIFSQGGSGPAWTRAGSYDSLGRLLMETEGAGQTTTETYDPNGNVLSITDGLQHTTSHTYDALNRLSTSTDATGAVTTPSYDAHDRIISLQDGNSNITSYVRDGFEEVIEQLSPDSGNTVFRYDGDGNVTSKVDALSVVTNQTFDALDRLLTTAYPADPSENVSYIYDQTGTGFSFGIGRLTSVTDAAGSLTRAYEERGNLTNEQRANGATVLATYYTYDGASRIATMTYPDGTLVTNQYNAAGYLSTVSALPASASAATTIATLSHLPFGPMNGATYGNGITEAWTYDGSYRPTAIADALSGTPLQNLTYAYDAANNAQSISDAVNPANSQTLGYDVVNRLTSATSGTNGYGSFAWTYDKVGNRLTQVQGSTTTSYGYASGTNRLSSITVSTTSAWLRPNRELKHQSGAGTALYAQAPPSIIPTPHPSQLPPCVSERKANAVVSALAWPVMLVGILGVVRFRKRLRSSPFVSFLCVLALTVGSLMLWTGRSATMAAFAATRVATPTFSPAVGTYASAQTVTISDATAGATIYYTTDGTTPTTSSTPYTSAITVSSTETVKAIATETGDTTSAVGTANYTIKVVTPTISPAAGTYTSAQLVTISDTNPAATIYYTTNGTTPTTSSSVYTGPITVSSTETIEAIAAVAGDTSSATAKAAYTIKVTTPTISPATGTYTSAQTVTISDANPAAAIYYTTDGTTPTTSSSAYTGPITVSSTETIEAIAAVAGDTNSAAAKATYTIKVTTPTISPAAGTYTSAQTVTISDTSPAATIYYTTDGTTPTTSSSVYTGPITVASTETIEAIAAVAGDSNSAVTKAAYTIKVATPTFSPAAGSYTSAQSVAISEATTAASIYYTIDGTTPTTSSTPYTAPITVSSNETIKAIAVETGDTTSAVGTAAYKISPTVATPTFSPAAGSYLSTESVTISDATAGTAIYYTTNGTTPTTSSTKYTKAITVSGSETIEAIATKSGDTTSAVAVAAYTVGAIVATPTFSPAAGTYPSAQSVTISDATNGASIYYTTNGATPSTSSTLYTGPIAVSSNETLQAIAVDTGENNSSVASAAYTIMPTVATPSISPAPGTYSSVQSVTITDSTIGATIYYTTDGTQPTTSSTVYSGPISVSNSLTIQAIAAETGDNTSSVAAAAYVINIPSVITVSTNANGNITSIPPANSLAYATFAYNNANRLASVTGSPLAANFIYDYAGQRFSKTDNGSQPIVYSYMQGGTLISESENGVVTDYLYADGRPIAVLQPGAASPANQVNYILADHLGTPQLASNSSGATVWQTTYYPFSTAGNINTSITQNLRFPGQYADTETGFSYNLNRDYIPNLGRYLETDPIGFGGGMNTYAYVNENPMIYVDTTGLDANLYFGPASKSWQRQYVNDPKAFTVLGEGSEGEPFDYLDPNGVNLSAGELAYLIFHDPNYKSGMPVEIFACNAGVGPNSYAQQVAQKLNQLNSLASEPLSVVSGPNGFVTPFTGQIIPPAEWHGGLGAAWPHPSGTFNGFIK